MDFGAIRRSGGKIGLEEFVALVDSKAYLEPIPDREGIDPFTKENVVFSGKGKAYYLENGERVGNISLENGVLLTTGVPESVGTELAADLGAEVFEDDRS